MQKYLHVTYYGMYSDDGSLQCDGLSVVKNFNEIYAPMEGGIYTKEEVLKHNPDATFLELDVMSNGYKRFKIAGETRWTMKGYGYIDSSDARFRKAFGSYPIPLHDRCEG